MFHVRGVRWLLATVCSAGLALGPTGAGAELDSGQASGYVAHRQTTNACTLWSPLFYYQPDGWMSTLVVRNRTSAAVSVDVRARAYDTGTVITGSVGVWAQGVAPVTATDLPLPEGFVGSITATACPSAISGLFVHEEASANRIALEAADAAGSSVFIPTAFNDGRGVQSQVVVFNTSREAQAPLTITYRLQGGPTVERRTILLAETATLLDLGLAPKGIVSIEIEGPKEAKLVAAAYHFGANGQAAAANGVMGGSTRVHLPLLFRKAGVEGAYDSTVRVVNVSESAAQPRITFFDRDTGERIGPVVASTTLRKGEVLDWNLAQLPRLVDNKVYSAVVEADDRVPLAAASYAASALRTDIAYSALTAGDTGLIVPLVYTRAAGLNSSLQIQNTSLVEGEVRVEFREPSGSALSFWTGTMPGGAAVTVDLQAVRGLGESFVGSADITSSVPVSAVVTTTRYLLDTRFTVFAALDPRQQGFPTAVAADAEGNVYAGLLPASEVWRITPTGQVSTLGPIAPGGSLLGLATDTRGEVYATLAGPADIHGVWRISRDGSGALRQAALDPATRPTALAVDGAGNIYVADSLRGQIWKVDRTGAASVWTADAILQGNAAAPSGVPVGANGITLDIDEANLYVAVPDFGRIVRVPIEIDRSAGAPQLVVEDARLVGASGIVFGGGLNLYVAVAAKNRLMTVGSTTGTVTLFAEGPPLRTPSGLAFGIVGDATSLYIANLDAPHLAGEAPGAALPALLKLPAVIPEPAPVPEPSVVPGPAVVPEPALAPEPAAEP